MMSGRLVCGQSGAGGNLQKAGAARRNKGKIVNSIFFFISLASDRKKESNLFPWKITKLYFPPDF